MTDIEISKALALAIGWKPEQLQDRKKYMLAPRSIDAMDFWHRFDYRDWSVIGPIAERYNCFPSSVYPQRWRSKRWRSIVQGRSCVYADTPQKAIALAVIGAKK